MALINRPKCRHFIPHKLHGTHDSYQNLDEINFSIIPTGLKELPFFDDDVFLGMQAINVGLVDQLITQYEYALLQEYNEIEKTPDSTMAVSALSQMWIYAVYEVLRMWRGRKFEFEKLQDNGGIILKTRSMIDDPENRTLKTRKKQMLKFQDNTKYRERIKNVWDGIEELFLAIELLRINLAKHEAPKSNIIPRTPGYARINDWCGAMDYELIEKNNLYKEKIDSDRYYTCLNRRDIADALRDFIVGYNENE
ncbi:MAG: hypothetical protein ACXWT1_17475 [Methylobacter sp.]